MIRSKKTGFFIFFGLLLLTRSPVAATDQTLDRLEAIVNKKPVFRSDLKRFRNLVRLRSKIDPLFASSSLGKASSYSDQDVLQFLIQEQMILQKYPVNDAEVEQEINTVQTNMKISRDGLKGAIAAEGFLFDDYFNLMRIAISKRQLLDREIRSKAAVSDDDIRNELNRTRLSKSGFSGSFQLMMIRLSIKSFVSADAAKKAAQDALDRLTKGEDFAGVAKSLSDDPSAESGGNIGRVTLEDLSKPLQTAIRKTAPGKPSAIINDGKSFVILKITDLNSDDDRSLASEKDQIRARLMESEFEHQIQLWLDRQRALNFIKINSGAKT